jgi:hypothetical protein
MFLRSSLAGAAGMGAVATGTASAGPGQASVGGPGRLFDGDSRHASLLTLIHRATQGFQSGAFEEAQGMGYGAWLEWQLAPESIDDTALDAILGGFPNMTMSTKEIWDAYGGVMGEGTVPITELRAATLLRSIYTRRQLQERMVEFWTDHFNIYPDGLARFMKTADDRDVIRAHALGNFEDLLRASAKSAAMSNYLNNATSSVGNINENYSRELMELHTLGVDGPYNEQDVKELARCFTGWSFYRQTQPQFGEFLFRVPFHDDEAKIVLGQAISAGGGIADGEFMITYLANHPSTAEFVTRKMARWLLGYDPSSQVIDPAVQAFLNTGGEIKDVLRVLLAPSMISLLPLDGQAKLRRPQHFVFTILRSTQPDIDPNIAPLAVMNRLGLLGHVPFQWVSPDGYPDDIESWGSGLLSRWDLASLLFNNQVPGIDFTGPRYLALLGGVADNQIAARINHVLTGGRLDPADVAEVQAYIDGAPSVTLQVVRDAFALSASSPSFQWY